MDTRLDYLTTIKAILQDYAEYYQQGGITLRKRFDDEHKSYMLLKIDWQNKKYIHRSPIHMEVIDGKIWIQHDDTEEGVATDLLKAGVPKKDIVLGFHHPKVRPHTGFAVN
jgi:hypothetical protein